MDQGQIFKAIEAKGGSNTCMSCGRNSWAVHDKQTLLSEFDGEGGAINMGSGIPAVLMICTNCGFVRMHAAKLLGV